MERTPKVFASRLATRRAFPFRVAWTPSLRSTRVDSFASPLRHRYPARLSVYPVASQLAVFPVAVAHLFLVRRMTACAMFTMTVGLFVSSCASPQLGRVPASPPEITRLLAGRWYQLDTVGGFELPHRLELTFSPDGTCAYHYIPKDPAQPVGIRRGTWRVSDGPSILFQWGRHSLGLDYHVDSGGIHHLDRRQLMIASPEPYPGFQSFYRSYRESLLRVPNA